MYRIKTYNAIADVGLQTFAQDKYQVAADIKHADALLLRSHKLVGEPIASSVQAVARAGVGVNNIPIAELSDLGIPVFNTPGANANAVKELVIAGMLLAARNICQAWDFVRQVSGDDQTINQLVEQNKKKFAGSELPGKTIAVIGLGAIGVQVANAANQLGMRVIGYDPMITIHRAWQLSADVRQAQNLSEALHQADFVSLHIPLTDKTRGLIDQENLAKMSNKTVLLNFARGEIVAEAALIHALKNKHLDRYVCDFPSAQLQALDNVIALPHLGASTREAEENCAVMAAKQLCDYLENGTINNSVNFPSITMSKSEGVRLTIANRNVPNMLGQISTCLADAGLNIIDMINKSHEQLAYTLVDVNAKVTDDVLQKLRSIDGVLRVRMI